ncbi:MAG: Bax inhibitor-1/YccA family protein [Mariprofundaceae bacterium]|nr:Bax inhibitor-1/YccA family protein [Mariprofundaceae bacterium]
MNDLQEQLASSNTNIDERIAFLSKTYGLLGLCIAAATVGTYMSMEFTFPREHPWMMLFALIGGIFAVNAVRHVPKVNAVALLGFGALSGAVIAPLVGYVASTSGEGVVAQAFMTTAITFGALTAYVFYSGKDFSFMRGFLVTGLIAMIVLMLLNYFIFESGVMSLAISGVCVLLFSGFILYDTSNILREYPSDEYISAALTLYINVFMLFQHLLYLFGVLNDD